jgi:hypothetical protein
VAIFPSLPCEILVAGLIKARARERERERERERGREREGEARETSKMEKQWDLSLAGCED